MKIYFHVFPRDFMQKEILLPVHTIDALNMAAKTLNDMSDGAFALVLTRGYVRWGMWRRFREKVAKIIFYMLYWSDRADAACLFGHNGHNDGLSVDVQLYDVRSNRIVRLLSWRNIFISRAHAVKIMQKNQASIQMLDQAMRAAHFVAHADPREKLQMHYRLE